MWVVRNNGGEYADEFLKSKIVAVGWQEAGPMNDLKTREEIIAKIHSTWPEYRPMQAVVSGSQLNKIVNIMKPGDRVTTYDPSKRIYYVGRVAGAYQFDADADDILANRRSVNWEGKVRRDDLSDQTKNSLGSSLSVFEISEVSELEFDKLLTGNSDTDRSPDRVDESLDSPEDLATPQYLLNDMRTKAKEVIKDRVVSLSWEDMQRLVAGLLRAMGYKTRVSTAGPDRGKDILASPDGFGFEQPRIVVEVKHRPTSTMGSQEIRSFLGGRHRDDKGLYVSTGGFSKDAKYEADRAAIPLMLMDVDELVDALIDYYEQLDLPTQTLVPLTRIYWPSD